MVNKLSIKSDFQARYVSLGLLSQHPGGLGRIVESSRPAWATIIVSMSAKLRKKKVCVSNNK